MPFAFLGVLLGVSWHRRVPWVVSISLGTILCTLGVFFRLWLLSILSGEDLWVYLTNQVTEIIEWLFLNLQILTTPSALGVKLAALLLIMINNLIYMFIVHLAAWLLLDRLGNLIPNPPHWIQVLMNYED